MTSFVIAVSALVMIRISGFGFRVSSIRGGAGSGVRLHPVRIPNPGVEAAGNGPPSVAHCSLNE